MPSDTTAKKGECRHCGNKHRACTPKQQAFADEYVKTMDATASAKAAGYTKSAHASSVGYQLLQKPPVQCELKRQFAARRERVHVDQDMVLGELLKLAMIDVGDVFSETGALKPLHEIPAHVRRAISSVKTTRTALGDYLTEVKFWPKVQSLELLGKHLKLFTEVKEVRSINLLEEIQKGRERARNGHGEHDGTPLQAPAEA